jgi:hypothetical protein
MKFGLDLPPQQRVYAGFFVYSFYMGRLPPRLPDCPTCSALTNPPIFMRHFLSCRLRQFLELHLGSESDNDAAPVTKLTTTSASGF